MMSAKKTILITGCSDGGMGSALCLGFQRTGWRVFASARNLSKLTVCEAAGIETLQLDVLSQESIAECVSKVRDLTGGSLDGLINNAGRGYLAPLTDCDLDAARDVFDLNVWSNLGMTRGFFPLLRESKHGALVVNSTSVAALNGVNLPLMGIYSASKAAAVALTETMRKELAMFDIKVVDILSGGVRTHFIDNCEHDKLPEDSAYAPARVIVEEGMTGKQLMEGSVSVEQWADKVVRKLNKRRTPATIWAGGRWPLSRVLDCLPRGSIDRGLKRIMKFDQAEKLVRSAAGAKNPPILVESSPRVGSTTRLEKTVVVEKTGRKMSFVRRRSSIFGTKPTQVITVDVTSLDSVST